MTEHTVRVKRRVHLWPYRSRSRKRESRNEQASALSMAHRNIQGGLLFCAGTAIVFLSKSASIFRRALPNLYARPRECLPLERGHFPYLWGSRLPGMHRGSTRINPSCLRGNLVGRPTVEPSPNNEVITLSQRRQNISPVYRWQ